MGKAKRKYMAEMVRFRKRLRIPLRNVLQTMPEGFSEDMFISEFKVLYAYLWEDICAKAQAYNRMDNVLRRKGFSKRYYFPSPYTYLKKDAVLLIRNKSLYNRLKLSPKERNEQKDLLMQQCREKQEKRRNKLKENLKLMQTVNPSYSNYYIYAYFKCKHENPTDVDDRYVILHEAAKYISPVTIKFLQKVNASERNFHLRQFAFLTLQKFGIKEVHLRKNRKGKKRKGDDICPTPIETPDDLIHYIYNSQMRLEQMKEYDLFLSHSSADSELLLKLKSRLNHDNLNVYIDWVNDSDALKRNLTNVNTAKVIIERLKYSKALMYVLTDSAHNSSWTPWELGFFHAYKGKICIYNPNNIIHKVAYLEIYPEIVLDGNVFFVKTDDGRMRLKEWLAQ